MGVRLQRRLERVRRDVAPSAAKQRRRRRNRRRAILRASRRANRQSRGARGGGTPIGTPSIGTLAVGTLGTPSRGERGAQHGGGVSNRVLRDGVPVARVALQESERPRDGILRRRRRLLSARAVRQHAQKRPSTPRGHARGFGRFGRRFAFFRAFLLRGAVVAPAASRDDGGGGGGRRRGDHRLVAVRAEPPAQHVAHVAEEHGGGVRVHDALVAVFAAAAVGVPSEVEQAGQRGRGGGEHREERPRRRRRSVHRAFAKRAEERERRRGRRGGHRRAPRPRRGRRRVRTLARARAFIVRGDSREAQAVRRRRQLGDVLGGDVGRSRRANQRGERVVANEREDGTVIFHARAVVHLDGGGHHRDGVRGASHALGRGG